MGTLEWALIHLTGILIRGDKDTDMREHKGKTMWRHREKVAVFKPRGEASRDTNPVCTALRHGSPSQLMRREKHSIGCLTKDIGTVGDSPPLAPQLQAPRWGSIQWRYQSCYVKPHSGFYSED